MADYKIGMKVGDSLDCVGSCEGCGKSLICGVCGEEQESPIQEHPCPFRSDVNNDRETMCTCCEKCENECAMDI